MFTLAVDGAEALSAWLAAPPPVVQAAVAAKAADLSARLRDHVVQDKLSGQVLKARSGALAASITAEVNADGLGVQARVFSAGDVKYAVIQEYGGRTGSHDILPDKAKALAFIAGGRLAFAKIVHHPGSQIPARSYLRSALADMADEISAGLKQAAIEALQMGTS
jgi:phage gpG-like protein